MAKRLHKKRLATHLTKGEWRAVADRLDLRGRHLQLAEGILDGFAEEQIADELGISPHTVHTYVKRLYRKLSVRNRADLVVRIFFAHVSCEREAC